MMKKILALMLALVMLLSCTAFAAETGDDEQAIAMFAEEIETDTDEPGLSTVTDPDEPVTGEAVKVTFTQFTLKNPAKFAKTSVIGPKAKVLWAIKVENGTNSTLENYDLEVPAPAALGFSSIDPYETDGDMRTFHIDELKPGYSVTVPVILTAPPVEGPVYRDANGLFKLNHATYEATAVLKPADGGTPSYASETVTLHYISFATVPVK